MEEEISQVSMCLNDLMLFYFSCPTMLYSCRYVGRPPSAAVATGNKTSHTHEEEHILFDAFDKL